MWSPNRNSIKLLAVYGYVHAYIHMCLWVNIPTFTLKSHQRMLTVHIVFGYTNSTAATMYDYTITDTATNQPLNQYHPHIFEKPRF